MRPTTDVMQAVSGAVCGIVGRYLDSLTTRHPKRVHPVAGFRSHVKATLRMAIQESGLRKREVARRAEMHQSVLSRVIRGDSNITIDSIAKVCHACGVQPFIKLEERD